MRRPRGVQACMALLLLVAATGPVFAQAKPPTAPGAAAQAMGAEALALFERVCIAALARREPAEAVATAELAGSPRVPADRLRANGPVRETAGWRVQGRHTVMMLEPGAQCAIYTEGIASDAVLDAVQALMLRAEALPGWARQGQPSRSASPRPFGMLTYRQSRYTSTLPPAGKPTQPGPPPVANILASAANRTDGRPNTAVITTDIEAAAR